MKATEPARSRPEPLARQHHAQPVEAARSPLHRRALGHGADLEPDDLRPRHQEQHRLRCRDPEQARQGKSGEELFFELALEDITRGGRPLPADPRPHLGRRRLGFAGSVAAAGPRHANRPLPRPRTCTLRRGSPTLHQDPRHARRPASHRGSDLRGRAGQCDAIVLREHMWRRPTPSARHRAAYRGGPARRRIGRLALHQPLGRRGEREGAGGAQRSARHRDRQANLQGLSRPTQLAPLDARLNAAPARNACSGPARAPRIRRRPTCSTSRPLAAPFTVNTMPEGTLKALADHGEVGATRPADGGNAKKCWRGSRRRRSTSVRCRAELQDEGAKSFVKSWNDLMDVIGSKSAVLERAS